MNLKQNIGSALFLTLFSYATLAQENKTIEVNIDQIDGKTVKTITVNGKQLSEEEITQMQADGELKIFHIGEEGSKDFNNKMIFIKSDEKDGSLEKHMKIITKKLHFDSGDKATLGFMANIKEDGWHVISVVANSGAEEAGVIAGDIITRMGNVDLTDIIENVQEIIELTQKQEGDVVELELLRDNQVQIFAVEARKNESADVLMSNSSNKHMLMLEGDDLSDLAKTITVMVSNNDHDFTFNEEDVNMVFPDDLSDFKVFIGQGESTSELLGKNHKLSTLSEGLSSYFKTRGGVLVLNIDQDNVFALEEGDVIKSINGAMVKVPKDVIKALLKAENQENIKMKIIRHKRNKTLKYNK